MKLLKTKKKPSIPGRTPSQPGNANVFSYYASRSARPEGSPTRRQALTTGKSKPKAYAQAIPSLLATAVITGSLLYLLWINTDPRIVVVPEPKSATLLQDISTYQRAGQEILSRSLLNRSKVTINTTAIARDMREAFPELADIAITTPLAGHRLVFEIEPAKPALVLASASASSYILDETGRAVVKATEVPQLGQLKIPLVQDESGLALEAGKTVLPSDSISFITTLLAQFKAKKISIEKLSLPTVANELHVQPKGERYFVKFNMAVDSRLQAGTYFAVRKKLNDDGVTPKEYIDVRVEEKAFYK